MIAFFLDFILWFLSSQILSSQAWRAATSQPIKKGLPSLICLITLVFHLLFLIFICWTHIAVFELRWQQKRGLIISSSLLTCQHLHTFHFLLFIWGVLFTWRQLLSAKIKEGQTSSLYIWLTIHNNPYLYLSCHIVWLWLHLHVYKYIFLNEIFPDINRKLYNFIAYSLYLK